MSDQKKERPILFSGEMVRAILAGRKTMTRRAVKPQPIAGEGVRTCPHCASDWAYTVNGGACSCGSVTNRYGNPGDRLWVKETFCEKPFMPGIVYRATCDGIAKDNMKGGKWKPSIFMPRGASRITLEIVETRIERLQDISEEDAQAEGATPLRRIDIAVHESLLSIQSDLYSHKIGYFKLWESINGPGSWDANPFVWVIEFKRLEGGAQ